MKEILILFGLFLISTIIEIGVYLWLLKPLGKTKSALIVIGLNVLKFGLPFIFQIITYRDSCLIYDSVSFDLLKMIIFYTVNDICLDISVLALLEIPLLFYLFPSSKKNKLSVYILIQIIIIVATICVNFMVGG